MSDWLTISVIAAGGAFVVLANIGVLRMPDLFTRMQASAKASTLGTGLVLLSAGMHFGASEAGTIVAAIIAFLVLTAPVAAHMIARAAYAVGVPLWDGTVIDELRGTTDAGSEKPSRGGVDHSASR